MIDSNCSYCGKPNTPARQVPAHVPVSDCYCDDCVERCRADHQPFEHSKTPPATRVMRVAMLGKIVEEVPEDVRLNSLDCQEE